MTERELYESDALVGYCEHCKEWHEFNKNDKLIRCPVCKKPYSNKIGCQITTKRSFKEKTPKVKK